jgi:hypothetical protein
MDIIERINRVTNLGIYDDVEDVARAVVNALRGVKGIFVKCASEMAGFFISEGIAGNKTLEQRMVKFIENGIVVTMILAALFSAGPVTRTLIPIILLSGKFFS